MLNKSYLTSFILFIMLTLTVSAAGAGDSGINIEDFNKNRRNSNNPTKDNIEQKWLSNPFAKSGAKNIRAYELYATAIRDGEAYALIDTQVVRVGDRIGQHEVVSILPGQATLRGSGGIFRLELKGGGK